MGKGDWNTAEQLCAALTFAGYSDWYLPDEYELVAMIQAKTDGWYFEYTGYYSYDQSYSYYWTSSSYSSSQKYRCLVESAGGHSYYGYGKCSGGYNRNSSSASSIYRFRPVRKDKLK